MIGWLRYTHNREFAHLQFNWLDETIDHLFCRCIWLVAIVSARTSQLFQSNGCKRKTTDMMMMKTKQPSFSYRSSTHLMQTAHHLFDSVLGQVIHFTCSKRKYTFFFLLQPFDLKSIVWALTMETSQIHRQNKWSVASFRQLTFKCANFLTSSVGTLNNSISRTWVPASLWTINEQLGLYTCEWTLCRLWIRREWDIEGQTR